MSDITNPFHAEVSRGVEDLAADYESNVILCNTDGRPTKEQAYIDLLLEKRVDGVIFLSAKMGESDVSMLQARRVPFVFAGRTLLDVAADSVVADSVLGGFQATNHLIGLGHRRIAQFPARRASPPASIGMKATARRSGGLESSLTPTLSRTATSGKTAGTER